MSRSLTAKKKRKEKRRKIDGAWSNEEVPVIIDSTTNNIAFFCLVIRNCQRCLQKYEK